MKKYYLCGPTVYNTPHIGNLRPILTFDLMIRALRYLKEDVYFLHNITDIDDKIINKAIKEHKTEEEIAKKYEKYYLEQLNNFNIEKPTKIVRVTERLQDLYNYIQKIIDKKHAYKINGNVYFDIMSLKDEYGKISHQKLDNLIYDELEDNSSLKKHPADFALWKETKIGVKYDSPFGLGRPGWHTECSCFIDKYFNGETLDAHGGGIDLIFPHHENENIQHFAIHNKEIAKQWLHFGTLNYKNQKMSKSIGNIIYPHDYLAKYSADSYRLLLFSSNYAKPINATDEIFNANETLINKFIGIWNKSQLENEHLEINYNKVNEIAVYTSKLDFAKAFKEFIVLSKDKNQKGTFFETLRMLGFAFINKKITTDNKKLYQQWKEKVNEKNYEEADKLRTKLIERKLI